MGWPAGLSELQASYVHVLLALAVALLLSGFFDRHNAWHRASVFGIAALLAIRYAVWRATETLAPLEASIDCLASWSFFAIELGAILSSLSAFVIFTRTSQRQAEVAEYAGWWGDAPPRVAVLIATYNESMDVLERTIVGARALDYPAVEIFVLDDGRRDWLKEFCAEHGVRHVTRPDNRDAKAGNMNHALSLFREEGLEFDVFAVLDADFVPHHDFLKRALALFHAPDVGLVQTPQHFFNADPIQHNFGLSRSYPDEQRLFFDHLQPSRDAWGIAFCCGTSSLIRGTALAEIGGFPTESVTEDFLLTLTLQDRGWRTVYLNEALTEGLAPEGLQEYVTQRARWCLGLMQIARSRLGPLSRNALRLRDRWSVADSVLYWFSTFSFRIAAVTFPLLYWFFNITVVDARVPDVISYFGVYFIWVLTGLNLVSRGLVLPIVNDVSQLLGAIPILRAAVIGLLRPKGHPFKVTAKGGDRSRTVVQWELMRPFLALFVLSVIGACIGIFSDSFAYNDAGDGKVVILFWTLYNLLVLGATILVCIELPRAEVHVTDSPSRATLLDGDERHPVWITELTTEAARLRGTQLPPGTTVRLAIPEVGEVPAVVRSRSGDGMRVRLDTDAALRQALLRHFHASGETPGLTRTRLSDFIADMGRRLFRD